MVFEYTNEGRNSRISKIKYTGNTVTGLSPYNEVQFFYKERQDKNTVFIAGSDINSNYLLERINTFSAGHLVRSYTFKYGFNKASYLTEVKESVGTGEELNATVFQYSGDPSPFFKQNTFALTQGGKFVSGDYNGDGITDLVHFTGSRVEVPAGNGADYIYYHNHYKLYHSISSGSGFNMVSEADLGVNYHHTQDMKNIPKSVDKITSDFNGDGLDDILFTDRGSDSRYQYCNNISVMFSNGNSFYSHQYGMPSTTHTYAYHKLQFIQIGDFDGDGVLDFLTIFGSRNPNNNWEVYNYEAHVTFSKNNQYRRFKIQDGVVFKI